MEAADLGASDGSVVIDQLWKRRLQKVIADEPIAVSLKEAVRSLPGVGYDDLEAIVDGQNEAWGDELHLPQGRFRLPISYPVDYAIAIHVYTLEDPCVYAVVNRAMFNPSRRAPGGSSHISDELRACLPYIKFLDAALAALPAEYVFRGKVRRGVKWVFPRPESHDPEAYFTPGAKLCWYEFKSASRRQELMTREHFCGIDAGPRTIFAVQACRAYDVARFSFYQGEHSEYEVLFRPLSLFKVVHSQKNIIDPRKKEELEDSGYHGMRAIERSGFPDAISLEQLDPVGQLDHAARRQEEKDIVTRYDALIQPPGEPWMLIDSKWLEHWRGYAIDHTVDDPPGPISNCRLVGHDSRTIPGLHRVKDYRGINHKTWHYFHSRYGGGPAICRSEICLYARAMPLPPRES